MHTKHLQSPCTCLSRPAALKGLCQCPVKVDGQCHSMIRTPNHIGPCSLVHEPLVQANIGEHVPVIYEMHGHIAHDILVPCPGIGSFLSKQTRDTQISLLGVLDNLPHRRHGCFALAFGLAVDVVLGLPGDFLFVESVPGQPWLFFLAVSIQSETYDNMSFVKLMNLPMSGIACRKLPISGYSAFGKMKPE